MFHPCNGYPFVDTIGRFAATVLYHVWFVKTVILDPRIGLKIITDVKLLVGNSGGRTIFEPFQLRHQREHQSKDYFHFPLMNFTSKFRRNGYIVQINDTHFDPVEILEEINDFRTLVNYKEVVEHENIILDAPDLSALIDLEEDVEQVI